MSAPGGPAVAGALIGLGIGLGVTLLGASFLNQRSVARCRRWKRTGERFSRYC